MKNSVFYLAPWLPYSDLPLEELERILATSSVRIWSIPTKTDTL